MTSNIINTQCYESLNHQNSIIKFQHLIITLSSRARAELQIIQAISVLCLSHSQLFQGQQEQAINVRDPLQHEPCWVGCRRFPGNSFSSRILVGHPREQQCHFVLFFLQPPAHYQGFGSDLSFKILAFHCYLLQTKFQMKANQFWSPTKEGSTYYCAISIRDETHGSHVCSVPGWQATHAGLHCPLFSMEKDFMLNSQHLKHRSSQAPLWVQTQNTFYYQDCSSYELLKNASHGIL